MEKESKKTIFESEESNKLNQLTYAERLSFITEFLKKVVANVHSLDQFNKIIDSVPELGEYSTERLKDVYERADYSEKEQYNISVAGLIFFILTKGKYPNDAWTNSINKYDETPLGKFCINGKNLSDLAKSELGDRQLFNEINNIVKKVDLVQEKNDIDKIINDLDCQGAGAAHLFELLWSVFVKEVVLYNASFWLNEISKYNKEFNCVENQEKRGRIEIHSVSSEGRQEKTGHNTCQDYAFMHFYDRYTWIAAVADGVGSCGYSALGSRKTEVLKEAIERCLKACTSKSYKKNRGKKTGIKSEKEEKRWAELMHFLKFELSAKFYKRWEEAIMTTDEYKESQDLVKFSTTLQFVFGCEKFIACGRVGDGVFHVRKKYGNGIDCGGVSLNDGYSGVMDTKVLTVPHLKNNPNALAIDFFAFDEVDDVILSSDGAEKAIGRNIAQRNKFVGNLRDLSLEARAKELFNVANACADFNNTRYGSGDDSTIVFIHINHKK